MWITKKEGGGEEGKEGEEEEDKEEEEEEAYPYVPQAGSWPWLLSPVSTATYRLLCCGKVLWPHSPGSSPPGTQHQGPLALVFVPVGAEYPSHLCMCVYVCVCGVCVWMCVNYM